MADLSQQDTVDASKSIDKLFAHLDFPIHKIDKLKDLCDEKIRLLSTELDASVDTLLMGEKVPQESIANLRSSHSELKQAYKNYFNLLLEDNRSTDTQSRVTEIKKYLRSLGEKITLIEN